MAKMRISPELKKLIEKYRCVKDTEGMSPAKVYKLVGENENLYLKMTDSRYKGTTYDVEREKDMMLWLEGKLPVPKVLHFERHDGWSNLLMSEADGVLCSEEYEDEQSPEKIIELYAECIRLFHSIDISDCPYTNILDNFQFIGGMKVGEPSADGRGSAPPELAEQQARAGSEAAPATPPL